VRSKTRGTALSGPERRSDTTGEEQGPVREGRSSNSTVTRSHDSPPPQARQKEPERSHEGKNPAPRFASPTNAADQVP